MDYSILHDAEINMKVCAALGLGLSSYARIIRQNDATILLDDNKTLVDYCNNPADAWPIISANRITIEYDAEHQCDVPVEWVTAYGIDGLKVHLVAHQPCDKALRSAMIVFLMMQESTNVQDNPA